LSPHSDSLDSLSLPSHSERRTIAFLAFLGILSAYGVDAPLPAFDEVRTHFGLGAGANVSLIGTLYFLGMASGQLIGGPLADRLGRRTMLGIGTGVYATGAFCALVAPSFGWLLAARLVWGLGASVPAVLRNAIARDLYSGDKMARVVSIAMAVFLLGPIFVPSIVTAMLQVGSFRIIFAVAIALAVVGFLWSRVFGETLPPERRVALSPRALGHNARQVTRVHSAVGFTLGLMFFNGAFIVYLGSSQPIIDRLYGRGSQFAMLFGLSGIAMAIALAANNRLIRTFGTERMTMTVATLLVMTAVVGSALALFTNGLPPFWMWFAWVTVSNVCTTLLSPMCAALAMGPLGDLAGTGSALMGAVMLAGGALLANQVDRRITTTITAMPLGYLVYSILGLTAVTLSIRSLRRAAEANLRGSHKGL
jgi:DHA1 family bicyclomycin/chloramphenicol resistance-like MFS transporter